MPSLPTKQPGQLNRVGDGPPSNSLGQNGDTYRDRLSGRDWEKTGGAWGIMFQPTLPTSKLTGSLPATILAGYPADQSKFLRGDGSWGVFAADVQAQTEYQGEIWNGSVAQTLANGVWTNLALPNAYIPAVGITYISSTLTLGLAGLWLVYAYIQWQPNATGTRLLAIQFYNQGGTIADSVEVQLKGDGVGEPMIASWMFKSVNVSQFLFLQAYQSSGGNLDVQVAKLAAVRVSS